MHSCLDFSENDFTKLLSDIKDNVKHRSVYNLGYLGIIYFIKVLIFQRIRERVEEDNLA